ncbi:hypothetical protein AX016_3130 [Cellulophaga sp. RHA19]|nr:hypothetical protein AX016_3130 [Cellulophaga sp. RHA19]
MRQDKNLMDFVNIPKPLNIVHFALFVIAILVHSIM